MRTTFALFIQPVRKPSGHNLKLEMGTEKSKKKKIIILTTAKKKKKFKTPFSFTSQIYHRAEESHCIFFPRFHFSLQFLRRNVLRMHGFCLLRSWEIRKTALPGSLAVFQRKLFPLSRLPSAIITFLVSNIIRMGHT